MTMHRFSVVIQNHTIADFVLRGDFDTYQEAADYAFVVSQYLRKEASRGLIIVDAETLARIPTAV